MSGTGPTLRYAIYTRQSVERPLDFSSCEAQFATCQEFAHRSQKENLVWIGQRFDDEGESGSTLDRPALLRLRELVRTGGVDRIYITALDRLARRLYDLISVLEEFERAGIALHTAHDFAPPSGAQTHLIRHLLGVFAEFEHDMIASRIAETRAYLKQHGRRLAGPAPFGYESDPITKQLAIVPNEARRARLIFQRAANGQTPSQIAFRINHLKWRTKTWLSRRSNQQRGGGKWTARQVLQLLRNPVYTGQHRDGKGTRFGCHAPIVEAELFAKVQGILDARRTMDKPRQRVMRFPLRQKIICPKCGRRLSTQVGSRPVHRLTRIISRYYCCRSTARGRAPCTAVRYSAAKVEQLVRDLLCDPATWRTMFPSDNGAAGQCASIWAALEHWLQDDLLLQVVETIRFNRKNTEIKITFNPRLAEIVSQVKQDT